MHARLAARPPALARRGGRSDGEAARAGNACFRGGRGRMFKAGQSPGRRRSRRLRRALASRRPDGLYAAAHVGSCRLRAARPSADRGTRTRARRGPRTICETPARLGATTTRPPRQPFPLVSRPTRRCRQAHRRRDAPGASTLPRPSVAAGPRARCTAAAGAVAPRGPLAARMQLHHSCKPPPASPRQRPGLSGSRRHPPWPRCSCARAHPQPPRDAPHLARRARPTDRAPCVLFAVNNRRQATPRSPALLARTRVSTVTIPPSRPAPRKLLCKGRLLSRPPARAQPRPRRSLPRPRRLSQRPAPAGLRPPGAYVHGVPVRRATPPSVPTALTTRSARPASSPLLYALPRVAALQELAAWHPWHFRGPTAEGNDFAITIVNAIFS